MSIEFFNSEAINVGNPTIFQLDPANDEFTLCGWFYVRNTYYGTIIAKRNFTVGGYQMAAINDTGGAKLFSNFGAVNHYGATAVDDDTWHCGVVVNRDVSGTLRSFLYLDGEDDSTTSPASGSGTASAAVDVLIGARRATGNTGTGFLLDGILSDVRIYNRALTENESKVIYNSRGNDKIYEGLIGRWMLNDNIPGSTISGTDSVKDFMSGKNDGAPIGSPILREDVIRFGRGYV